jgi:site-specific DNA-methyltransferase (adenine-specific)
MGRKKGADSRIDGLIYFKPEGRTTEKGIVSLKGGENGNVLHRPRFGAAVDRERRRSPPSLRLLIRQVR